MASNVVFPPGTPSNLNTAENTNPVNISASTVKQIVLFIVAGIFLLILVQYWPKYIIGLTLLIILSVFLYDYQKFSTLLTGL